MYCLPLAFIFAVTAVKGMIPVDDEDEGSSHYDDKYTNVNSSNLPAIREERSLAPDQDETLKAFHSSNQRLFLDLMHDYQKALSPYYTNWMKNGSTHPPPMKTTATLTWLRIVKLDQVEQVMKIIAEIRMIWTDHRLEWDPFQYNGIEHIYIARSHIWVPELTVGDSEMSYDVAPEYKQNVLIDYTGRVLQYYNIVSHSVCPLQTSDFPFDAQKCDLCLIELFFNKNESFIFPEIADRIDYKRAGNGEWDITGANITQKMIKDYDNVEFDLMCYDFSLKRKSNFYVMVIIVPTFIITTLSITGIFAKRLSGDDFIGELTLGLTSLMTLTVMLGIVADSLPKTNTLPVLSTFITVELTLTALSVLVVIIHPKLLYPKIRAMGRRMSSMPSSNNIIMDDKKDSLSERLWKWLQSRHVAANFVFMLVFQTINFANLSYILSFW